METQTAYSQPLPHHIWSIPFLSGDMGVSPHNWALIVLNQPLDPAQLIRLWRASRWHLFADGGANRVYDSLSPDERAHYLPDYIEGDLDSIRNDVEEYYKANSVAVIRNPDQDSTDLMKCINTIIEIETAKKSSDKDFQIGIIILGGLTGRLDQTVHTMSQLYKLRKTRPQTFVVTPESLAWALDTGTHSISLDLNNLGPTCGLLPVGVTSTIISTRGLKWNLDETESSFDGLVSTSNALESSEIWIKTTHPIIWSVEIRGLSKV